MKLTTEIFVAPPGFLEVVRDSLENQINHHSATHPMSPHDPVELGAMQRGLNRAIERYKAPIAKLRRVIQGDIYA